MDEPPDTHTGCIQSNEDERRENPEENDSTRKCLSNTAELYPKTEEEKEYERAMEWLEKLPLATRRSFYNLGCKNLLTRSAYGEKRNRGLLKSEILKDSIIDLGKVIINLDKESNKREIIHRPRNEQGNLDTEPLEERKVHAETTKQN